MDNSRKSRWDMLKPITIPRENELREMIRVNPNDAEAHYNLGSLLMNLQRYDEAEKELREAIKIDPNYVLAHFNLGVLLKNLQRYDEAEKELREAIRIDPSFAEAHYNLELLTRAKTEHAIKVENKIPGLAVLLSFLFPGLGQIYNGQIQKGIRFIIAGIVSLVLTAVVIGNILYIIIWIIGMVDAYNTAKKIHDAILRP
jgi:tetratricopeptide (TPR) repeat protein